MFKKTIKASSNNSKFFQRPTCTYRFVLAAEFVHPNIAPFVILFLEDIVK